MTAKRIFSWIIGAPVAVLLVSFAVANRHWTNVSFDPLNKTDPWLVISMPTYLLLFAGIFIGTLAATMFVPLFRVAGGQAPDPPLIPIVAVNAVVPLAASFIGVMLLAELVIIALALKGRLFTALRM